MLHLQSSNGYQNTFSLNVYGSLYGSTINSTTVASSNVQYIPTSAMLSSSGIAWYIKLTEQATQKEYFGELGQRVYGNTNFSRSKEFFLFLDDYVGDYHININTTGLYNFEVFWGTVNAVSSTSAEIIASVCTGMVMVHNDNFENNYFQNSENGVEELTIPTTIAYNG